MASLFGTLVTVKDFLNNVEMPIDVIVSADQKVTAFTLPKDRTYVIPGYQREIRWGVKQLQELIRDVTEGKQFLGNVILSKKGKDFEIIDGQQRVTVLCMLVTYIKKFSPNPASLPIISPCILSIDSFLKFNLLHDNNYSFAELDERVKTEILDSDDYHQCERYIELWNQIKSAPQLVGNAKMRTFLERLQECQVNLIITDEGNSNLGIEYFVDVNQKGIRLDDEDTLKGYLFQFNAEDVKPLWVKIKKESFKITNVFQCKYSLLKMFEQYFYCELYKDKKYESLKFKEEFTLEDNFDLKENESSQAVRFPKDTHLIQVLRDYRDILADLNKIYTAAELIGNILENFHPSSTFINKINPYIREGEDKLGVDAIECIYGLIRKILMDSNEVPKALALKYLLDVMLNNKILSESNVSQRKLLKEKYYSVFSLYALSCLFTMFASKKQGEQIYNAVKGTEWEKEVANSIKKFTNSEEILKGQTYIAYRTFCRNLDTDSRREAWRCKAMATLYNFLVYDVTRKVYTFKNHGQLFSFLNDTNKFSLEHFLLNESSRCTVQSISTPIEYPAKIKKYIGSMFNYLYIAKCINSQVLGNRCLPEKLEILNRTGAAYENLDIASKTLMDQNPLECEYSKQLLIRLNTSPDLFAKYKIACASRNEEQINKYFEDDFENEYNDFVRDIVSIFLVHIRFL